jgi:hypothetical protein
VSKKTQYRFCFVPHAATARAREQPAASDSLLQSLSDAYEIAVKVVEREIAESSSPKFVQRLLYVLENGYRYLFAE